MFYSDQNRCLKKMCMNKLDIVFTSCILKERFIKFSLFYYFWQSARTRNTILSRAGGRKKEIPVSWDMCAFCPCRGYMFTQGQSGKQRKGKTKEGPRIRFLFLPWPEINTLHAKCR